MISELNCYLKHEEKSLKNAEAYNCVKNGKIEIGINLSSCDEKKMDMIALSKWINNLFLQELFCSILQIEFEKDYELVKGVFKKRFKECKYCRPLKCVDYINEEESLVSIRIKNILKRIYNIYAPLSVFIACGLFFFFLITILSIDDKVIINTFFLNTLVILFILLFFLITYPLFFSKRMIKLFIFLISGEKKDLAAPKKIAF